MSDMKNAKSYTCERAQKSMTKLGARSGARNGDLEARRKEASPHPTRETDCCYMQLAIDLAQHRPLAISGHEVAVISLAFQVLHLSSIELLQRFLCLVAA
jgi:hypothetical protein